MSLCPFPTTITITPRAPPFFSVVINESRCMFASGPSSSSSEYFFIVIHLAFLLYSFFPYLAPKVCFSFTCGCLFIFIHSPPASWKNFLLLFWKVLFCLYYLTLSRYYFFLVSFFSPISFDLNYSIVSLVCIYFPSFRTIMSLCNFPFVVLSLYSFFICPNLISYPVFVFLFGFLGVMPIS